MSKNKFDRFEIFLIIVGAVFGMMLVVSVFMGWLHWLGIL